MELSLEQQRYAILKAVELKLVSATSLDTKARGARISMMKRGMNVSAEVIKRHYENLEKQIGQQEAAMLLQDFQEESKPTDSDSPMAARMKSPKVVQTPTKPAREKAAKQEKQEDCSKLQGELEEANARIARLEARIVELEEEKRSLNEKFEESKRGPVKIQGWSIIQRRAGGGDCKYWYAGKSMSGRMQWIYLGKVLDLEAAKSKIEVEEKKREQRERFHNFVKYS
jgi:hypothetical protein